MADLFRLDGKVAVVVGGGGGIGKALALGLARQGAELALASRNLEKLDAVAKELAADPDVKTQVRAFQLDCTDETSVTNAAKEIVSAMGTVDILVNAQGQNIKEPFENQTVVDWNTLFDNNVKGVMLCCREFGKVMLEKKKGKIINIGSVAGDRGVPLAGNVGYCSSKAAVGNRMGQDGRQRQRHRPLGHLHPDDEEGPAAGSPGRRDRPASHRASGRAGGAHGHLHLSGLRGFRLHDRTGRVRRRRA